MKASTLALSLVMSILVAGALACSKPEEEGAPTTPAGQPPTPSPTATATIGNGQTGGKELPPTPSARATRPSGPTRPAALTPAPTATGGMVAEPAPIIDVSIQVLETFPPQYRLHVEFGLANGCIKPGGYSVNREGETIQVKVLVQRPDDETVVCTQQYGTASYDISLGSDFVSGKTYTVHVNDAIKEFVAQ